jgi:tetratricopeptide (TPR) repeat protein
MIVLMGVLFLSNSSAYAQTAADYINQGNQKAILNKDYDGGIAEYTQAITLDPQNVDAYIDRGDAKYNKNDIQGAIADYTQAIALNPNNARAYNERSRAEQSLGDSSGANADLTRANALDPSLNNPENLGI